MPKKAAKPLDLDFEEAVIEVPEPMSVKIGPAARREKEAVIKMPGRRPTDSLAVDDITPLIEAAESYFGTEVTALTVPQQLVLLKYLQTGNASRSCASVGVSVATFRGWLAKDERFRQVWDAADEALTDLLEEKSIRIALTSGDVQMLKFLLEGRRREKYGKRVEKADTDQKAASSWAELARRYGKEEVEAGE